MCRYEGCLLKTLEGGGSPSHTCLHTHTPQDAGAIKLYLKIYHYQCSEAHSARLRAFQWLLWMFSWFKMFEGSGEKYLIPGFSSCGSTFRSYYHQDVHSHFHQESNTRCEILLYFASQRIFMPNSGLYFASQRIFLIITKLRTQGFQNDEVPVL